MKILFLELSGSESCARSPSKYSGAGPTMRRLVEKIPNAYLAAETSCFESDATSKCISLNKEVIQDLRSNYSVEGIISVFLGKNFDWDLIVYSNPTINLNTEICQLNWALGHNETVHSNVKNLLVHNLKWQKPVIQNPNTKVHEFILGIDIPPFQEYRKRDFCFQCSNHYPAIQSISVANICRRNRIPCILAGPSSGEYRKLLLAEVDYKFVYYLGEIDEEEKIKLMKEARCYTNLVSHHINGPQLSLKTAWSYGTPVIATPMGIMPEVIQEGVNGFLIKNEQEFLLAYEKSQYINQKSCWETSTNWSIGNMVDSFLSVADSVMKGKA